MPADQPPPVPPPHIGPILNERSDRERFAPHELAIVLSHYDLGVIRQIRPFPRGSRRAPKLRLRSDRGAFLLKRRAPGRDDPLRVAFAHGLQLALAERGYPVPRLIGTRDDNNSMVQLEGRIYELFEFVTGERYDRSPGASSGAGAALGSLHRLLADFQPAFAAPVGSYHGAADVKAALAQLVPAVCAVELNTSEADLGATVEGLRQAYHDAVQRVDQLGYRQWPACFLHGDWHPGNLLYRDGRVVAVLDFDSARREPRLADVANGALQFSMRMTSPDDPLDWPEALDVASIRALVQGYDSTSGEPISSEERAALPWLIIEALIFESIVPIVATGSFARIPGSRFLAMVQRKVRWLRPRAEKLVRFLAQS